MKRYNNNQVLLIPDVHAPYHHKDTLAFLEAVAGVYNPDRVFQLGDWTDSYAFSRYPKDMDHKDTYSSEYKKVRQFTKDLVTIFPKGTALKGNHDARLWNRAKLAGVPKGLLIPYERVIGLEETDWDMQWDLTFTVDANRKSWFLAHTKTASPLNTGLVLGRSVAFGHDHTKFKIESFQSIEQRIYGVHCGCLIGDDRYAFAYNRSAMIRPNLGCVVITRGVPKLIPMETGPSGRWNKIVH